MFEAFYCKKFLLFKKLKLDGIPVFGTLTGTNFGKLPGPHTFSFFGALPTPRAGVIFSPSTHSNFNFQNEIELEKKKEKKFIFFKGLTDCTPCSFPHNTILLDKISSLFIIL